MPFIDFGSGEQEFRCTARTLVIYEQAFYNDKYPRVTGDMIADVFGKRVVGEDSLGLRFDDDGNIEAIVVDYTTDNWQAELRALWAMLRTQAEIDKKNGVKRDPVPVFNTWSEQVSDWEPDMREVSNMVYEEMNRGLFRAGAAASE